MLAIREFAVRVRRPNRMSSFEKPNVKPSFWSISVTRTSPASIGEAARELQPAEAGAEDHDMLHRRGHGRPERDQILDLAQDLRREDETGCSPLSLTCGPSLRLPAIAVATPG